MVWSWHISIDIFDWERLTEVAQSETEPKLGRSLFLFFVRLLGTGAVATGRQCRAIPAADIGASRCIDRYFKRQKD